MKTVLVMKDVIFRWPSGRFELRIDHLALQEGERLAVTGPSGSGKSTLLALSAGLLTPSEGTIHALSQPISTLGEDSRRNYRLRQVGLLLQQGGFIEHLSVMENVLVGQRLAHPWKLPAGIRERAMHLLEQTGLQEALRRYPSQLSGGEQRRLALCRALVSSPLLILLDEPTASLDGESARIVRELLISHLDTTGASILCATHDRLLAEVIGRAFHLSAGRVCP